VYVRIVLVVLALSVVAALGFAYHLASHVLEERHNFEAQVRKWVQDRTTITQIDAIEEYRGKQSYAVVLGKNATGTPVVAWLTAEHVVFDRLDLAVPKVKVEETAKRGFPQGSVLHVVPALEGEQRFWEVTLRDSGGRYHYLHYDFFSGKLLKSYAVQSIARS
jgi:uncharacterized protein YpmB